jgi:hypothetical protein
MKQIYKLILEELNQIVKIKGGRGFGSGAVYRPFKGRTAYGKSAIEYEIENDSKDNQEDKKTQGNRRVKISRAFTRK